MYRQHRRCGDRYLVSPKKTALAVAIANREKDILKDIDYDKGYSLYVGIPFCPSICLYCSFSSYPLKLWASRTDEYLDALCKEAEAVASLMKSLGRKLDTIYIGGGTPTTLEPYQLERLLDCLSRQFGYDGLLEFTVGKKQVGRIALQKKNLHRSIDLPVTRISVNPQTDESNHFESDRQEAFCRRYKEGI